MDKPIVFMFSGQGSQYYQMGKNLYESNPVFKERMDYLDGLAKNISGESVLSELYSGDKRLKSKGQPFNRTRYTHPSIFMVEYAISQVMLDLGVKPDYLLGSSLGEFISAAISGCLSIEDAFELVLKQAELLESNCEKGGMIAIMDGQHLYDSLPEISQLSEFAGTNYPEQFVVAGEDKSLNELELVLRKNNVIYQRLAMQQGFHSAQMDSIQTQYIDLCNQIAFKKPQIPVISALKARELDTIDASHFMEVGRNPINYYQTVSTMEAQQPYVYIDLGPSGSLATFVKYSLPPDSQSRIYSVMTPFGSEQANIDKLLKDKSVINRRERHIKEAMKMKAYVFPGQGSQYKGMGKELFDEFPDLVAKANRILGYSIEKLCLSDPNNELSQTQFTQPAIFIVSALSYLKKMKTGSRPNFVAGHSLGEYNALFAAGAFDFETGVELVKKRGELMSRASGGAMAAVLGLDEHKIREILKESGLSTIDVANYNGPTQTIVAGTTDEIDRAADIFEAEEGARYIVLNVSAPFHSRYMRTARDEFEQYLSSISFQELAIPVISNVKARPYESPETRSLLVEQITSPVKWADTVRLLMANEGLVFEEVGPGSVLTGLVEKIQAECEPLYLIPNKKAEITPIRPDNKSVVVRNLAVSKLGSRSFVEEYNVRYAYVAGSMCKGISSVDMIVRLASKGILGFFGSCALPIGEIEVAIQEIQKALVNGESYGMNLTYNPSHPELEEETVDLYLKHGVCHLEASSYLQLSEALVKYRLNGVRKDVNGEIVVPHKVLAKVTRPESAELFLSPPPKRIVSSLLEGGKITQVEADLAAELPMADDLCAMADSAWHTEKGNASVLIPSMIRLRNKKMSLFNNYSKKVRVGAGGGMGTPESIATAFLLGADFVLTGSINQCSVEASTSTIVKDLLQNMNIQDTDYAPAEEMFEMGAMVQVLKKGGVFKARSEKLYLLYRQFGSWDEIDQSTKTQIEERFFGGSFQEIFEKVKVEMGENSALIKRAENNPKAKMSLVFKWYLHHSVNFALQGVPEKKVDFQIYCSPILGAFNQWVSGTELNNWQNRHVDFIAKKLMEDAELYLSEALSTKFQC